MTDERGPNDASSPDPSGVPSEWSRPASSLPPPPHVAPPSSAPVSPASTSASSVSTGPVMAAPPRRSRWLGRGVALAAAAVLVGGGGYLAISAGSADDGAESPRSALDGALDALSAEDLIGAAEFVEPTERETLVAAGFDVIDELIRLDVFGDSLDLSSVDGVDFEFDDIEIEVTEVRPGMAHLHISSGDVTAAIDGSAVPFGPLITDRVAADTLAVDERRTESITRADYPIVAVERDGRWYLSLWYSVAENARLELGQPLPDRNERINQVGADTPERAVENFVAALEHLDVATMIGMLDPTDAAALYDYAPLFIDDAQEGADDFVRTLRADGWSWEVTDLEVRAETEGSQSTVFIEGLGFRAGNGDDSLDASFGGDRMSVRFESDALRLGYVVEGDCVTVTFDEGYGAETDSFCTDELLGGVGLGSLTQGAMGGIATWDEMGVVVRNVGGRWYISPIRTGSELMLQSMRALDPEMVADTVDAMIDLFNDPFAFESALSGDTFGSDLPEIAGTTTTYPAYPPLTEENAHLLADGLDYLFVYDLVDVYRDDVWWQWLTDITPREFGDAVVGQAFLPDGSYIDVLVFDELEFETDAALAEWLGGEPITVDGFTYVSLENDWDERLLVARSEHGIAVVVVYDELSDAAVAALRQQVGG